MRSRGFKSLVLSAALPAAIVLSPSALNPARAGSGGGSYTGVSIVVENGMDAEVARAAREARDDILSKLKEKARKKKAE